MFNIVKKEFIFNNKILSLETGRIGKQASSVIARYGNTVVMANVTVSKKEITGIDFVPLTVSYIEKFYAVGEIPGGFIKRETKPSDHETLIARTIDRPIRPLFPSNYRYETNIFCTLLSYEEGSPAEVVAMIAASTALAISPVPFNDIVVAMKVAYKNNKYILNDPKPFNDNGTLDLTVAGTKDSILMVESEAKELSEDEMLNALDFGHNAVKEVIQFIESFVRECNFEKLTIKEYDFSKLEKSIYDFCYQDLKSAYNIIEKQSRVSCLEDIYTKVKDKYSYSLISDLTNNDNSIIDNNILELDEDSFVNKVDEIVKNIEKDIVRTMILNEGRRIDGRKIDEVRKITTEVDILPVVHGSALFTRGETQALVITTLGSKQDEQLIDNVSESEESQDFILHYNFPPYAVGECGALKAPGRREIGHGKLAWKAIHNIVQKDNFPYTIRVVSEITESNGSSSMATVCGTSLSLMASGVPMKSPVSGIAMGLIKEENSFVVLSDIMGDEDHLGDMDFKVAGTKDGITALQMDIKCKGVNRDIMNVALKQAKGGRYYILDKMSETISKSRDDISPNAPRALIIKINPANIKDVIGVKGKVIKEIIDKTGASIDILDDGSITIMSSNSESANNARRMIEDIVSDIEIGKIYEGVVVKIVEAGAFVSLCNGKCEGFVHISQLANHRIKQVEDVIKMSDSIKVKVIGFDRNNKPKLSYKLVNQETGESL